MTLEEIRALVHPDLSGVDQVIRSRLRSEVPLVERVAEHIISGGGKRLRPLLVVLAGRACGYSGHAHVEAAAFIEFIHTATLLHDDVVDASSMRRGREPGRGRSSRCFSRMPRTVAGMTRSSRGDR